MTGLSSAPARRRPSGDASTRKPVKICLAASGGGHLRQILDLRDFWQDHDHYLVTEPTALAETLAAAHPVRFVPHFAYGQAKVSSWGALIVSGIGNIRQSWKHAKAERPDVIISTGAGSAFFSVLFSKLFGARFILIESFARVHRPSLFGRMARPFADRTIVQSAGLLEAWPGAEVCDPLVLLGPFKGEKENLAVVTVGTVMPFDRLVSGVARLADTGKLKTRIVAQVAQGGIRPGGIEAHDNLDFDALKALLAKADIVFCHGGTGSLVTALQAGCRVIAMPRQAARGEHYDDHQQEIVSAFAGHGLIQVADDEGDLDEALARAMGSTPVRATTDPQKLRGRLAEIIGDWFPQAQRRIDA